MVSDDFDGILSDEDRQQLQKVKEEHGIQMEPATPEDVDQGYKDLTGNELNPDMSGNDMGEAAASAPITEEVGQQAQEAVAPIKDQVTAEMPEQSAQRDNAFTQLEDPTPAQQVPEQAQEQAATPNQEQAPGQAAQRDNAFTEMESSAPSPQSPGQEREQQTTPTASAPESSQQRDNAFTQLEEATPPDQAGEKQIEQDKER